MKLDFYKESRNIWKDIAGKSQIEKLNFELEIHKKLLSLFQVGDFYYFIFNLKHAEFEYVSHEIIDVLGYEASTMSVSRLLDKIHPDDQPYFLNFENKICDFLRELTSEKAYNYKMRYDYRIRNIKGEYVRILHQVVLIQGDDPENILYSFGVHTDISHLKQSGVPVLSFIGLNGEPSFINIGVEELFKPVKSNLTAREMDVLKLLASGYTSAQIAIKLHLSRFTVDTHRRNILKKTKCISTYELISKGINEGWI